jgi:hypothetical protein
MAVHRFPANSSSLVRSLFPLISSIRKGMTGPRRSSFVRSGAKSEVTVARIFAGLESEIADE